MKESFLKLKYRLLSPNYNLNSLRSDVLSALSVALLALPQSMAYALIVGLPLYSGILAAIFGTILTSSFGHSRHLISGPTNATAILIQAGTSHILYQHFNQVPEELKGLIALQIISQIVLFMGLIQILIGVFKLGGFTQFISRSVMMGYILGVTLYIWLGQAYTLFSIERPAGEFSFSQLFPYLLKHLSFSNPLTIGIGVLSLLILITLKKFYRKLPRSLIMLVLAALVTYVAKQFLSPNSSASITQLAAVEFDLSNLLKFHFIHFNKAIIKDLLFISLAIALFSIFEVNSISRLISAKSGQRMKTNRDIWSVGISNFFSSFFLGTLPSSGSPSRTIFNYQNGAKSRFAGVLTGIFILIILSVCYPLIHFIPTASLAAILLMIGYEIIDFKLLKICLKATKRDALVLTVTTLSCLFFQLDIALFIGIALSLILYLRLAAETNILEYVFTEKGHFKPMNKNRERVEKRIRILNMEGNLFFGSIDSLQKKLHSVLLDQDVEIIILRFTDVRHLDASICCFLEVFANNLKKQGKSLYLCEMIHSTIQVVHESPLLKKLGEDYLYERDHSSPIRATEQAFAHALEKLNSIEKTPS